MAAFFEQFLADTLSLRFGQIIDKQFAFKMIHFMLDANGKQAFRLHLLGDALSVEETHPDMLCALNLLVIARH